MRPICAHVPVCPVGRLRQHHQPTGADGVAALEREHVVGLRVLGVALDALGDVLLLDEHHLADGEGLHELRLALDLGDGDGLRDVSEASACRGQGTQKAAPPTGGKDAVPLEVPPPGDTADSAPARLPRGRSVPCPRHPGLRSWRPRRVGSSGCNTPCVGWHPGDFTRSSAEAFGGGSPRGGHGRVRADAFSRPPRPVPEPAVVARSRPEGALLRHG